MASRSCSLILGRLALAAAHARRGDELLARGAGLARDLAERVATGLEVDHRAVLVADHPGGTRLAGAELGRHGHAGVAACACVELLVRADRVHAAWERLALHAADRSVEVAAADARPGVGEDLRVQLVHERRSGFELLVGCRLGRGDGGGAAVPRPLMGLEPADKLRAALGPFSAGRPRAPPPPPPGEPAPRPPPG